MIGREDKKLNDLFFTCALIEYIARKTKNYRSVVVNVLGRVRLEKIYELADVYHSDNIERVSEDLISETGLENGNFDNVESARFAIPSHWDMAKVYKRLIIAVANEKEKEIIPSLIDIYNSFISDKIQDYNSSFYYDNPQNILNAYLDGKID